MSAICRRAERRLRDVVPHLEVHASTYDVLRQKGGKWLSSGEKACVIDYVDEVLETKLMALGKQGGRWSSRGSFEIVGQELTESDIPVSQSGTGKRPMVLTAIKGFDRCDVEEVHIHDSGDPAVHLHVKCPDVSGDGLEEFVHIVRQANEASRRIAGLG